MAHFHAIRHVNHVLFAFGSLWYEKESDCTNNRTVTILLEYNLLFERLFDVDKSRKENPQKLTQLSSRSHPRHLVGKRTAQKDTIIDIPSDSQVNSNVPNRWSPASLPFITTIFTYFYIYI